MPLKRCQRNGKKGWKWGDSGKCFLGPDAKQRASAQGRAIEAEQAEKDQASGADDLGGTLIPHKPKPPRQDPNVSPPSPTAFERLLPGVDMKRVEKTLTSGYEHLYLKEEDSMTSRKAPRSGEECPTAKSKEGTMATEKRDAVLLKFIMDLGKQAEGIQFVIGRLKGETTTTVQSILFDKEMWTIARAKKWLKDNDFKSGKVDETEQRFRFKQREVGDFQEESFRTIDAGERGMSKGFPVNDRGWTTQETFERIAQEGRKFTPDEARLVEPAPDSARTCGTCRFFLRDEESPIGRCQVVGGPIPWWATSELFIDATAESAAAFAVHDEEDEESEMNRIQRAWPILKATADGKFIVAPILVPDEPDLEGDVISAEEIETAAHDFMEYFQNVGLMHQRMLQSKDVVMVESTIMRTAASIGGQKLPKGTWLGAFKIHNEKIQQAVREKKLTGVSIGGSGIRTEISEEE